MTERITETSPCLKARIAGVLWLLDAGVGAPFAEFFVRGRLIVYRDPAATASNIQAHLPLYRLGASAWLIAVTCTAAVALLLYELLKPVSKSISLLAAVFRLMFVAVMAVNVLNYFAPLILLGSDHFLTAFNTDQLQALTLASHTLFNTGYDISMVFWGLHIILIGCLIFRSAFLPRILGALLAVGGLCYLTNSFADFLAPAFGDALGLYIVVPGALAELLLILWLLVKGVNLQRWKEQASAAGEWRTVANRA
jgi:Domain of unknown function (DUF4386)